MKIKNEHIIIRNGQKQIKLHNLILNTYIAKLVRNQVTINWSQKESLEMYRVFIKFDDELEFNKRSILTKNDFDLVIYRTNYQIENSLQKITIDNTYYIRQDYEAYEVSSGQNITDYTAYNGKKITALGFGAFIDEAIFACIDMSKYNIFLDIDSIFEIYRRDVAITDGELYSTHNLVKMPIHLYNGLLVRGGRNYKATLVAVGFGITKYKIDEEHSLLPYGGHIELGADYINILDEYIIEYLNEGLFPATDTYPTSSIYPARIIGKSIYPSEDIYPDIDFYPTYAPYQYMQLKYRITAQGIEDDGYYIVSIPINGKKKIKMNINYERA